MVALGLLAPFPLVSSSSAVIGSTLVLVLGSNKVTGSERWIVDRFLPISPLCYFLYHRPSKASKRDILVSYETSAQPAGWYYAAGDPPGTNRYWDGTQWQGAPQPVAAAPIAGQHGRGVRPAEYGPRFVAALINGLAAIAAGVAGALVGALAGVVLDGADVIGVVIGFVGFYVYNNIYLLGTTGQNVGKKQQKIKLIVESTGQPIGVLSAFARLFIGAILTRIFLLDLIWIFIDDENRRLTDKIFKFNVIEA